MLEDDELIARTNMFALPGAVRVSLGRYVACLHSQMIYLSSRSTGDRNLDLSHQDSALLERLMSRYAFEP